METVIYIRWSSGEQGKGSTLQRQREECHAHAARKGWKVVGEVIDDGVSAFKGKHVATGHLGQFVASVEAGAFPDGIILLTEKLDRLSREPAKKVFAWLLQITEMGVVVATVDGDRCYDRNNLDMAAIIEVVVKAQLANEESEKKASRLSAAWASKRKRLESGEKIVLTRRAPAWLTVEGTPPKFTVIPERAAIVRRIFTDTVAGLGKHHIVRNLNREGVAPFGRAMGWHASYVQKILTNPSVLGEFQPARKPRGEARERTGLIVTDYYPQVVDADLYAAAQRSMAGRQRRVAGRGRRLPNLFSGIAVCAHCSSRMTFRAKGRKQRANGDWVNEDYLICDSYQRGRGCNNGQHFNYQLWEAGILDAILLDAMEDRHFSSSEMVRPLEIDLAERLRERAEAKQQSEMALSLYLETDRIQVKERWLDLTKRVDQLDIEISQCQSRLVEARGIVSPEEHRQRIFALRNTLQDKDENTRFITRSRIAEAIHELISSMRFFRDPIYIEIITRDHVAIEVNFEEWGDSRGTTWSKWMLDAANRANDSG